MRPFLQPRAWDAAIAELAGRQHGVVGLGQLVGLGVGEDAVARRVRGGRLHRVHAGVYSVGHRVLTQRGRWTAAVLACIPRSLQKIGPAVERSCGVALSHRSAAALWGIRPHNGTWIDVTAPSRSRSSKPIRRHYGRLPTDEIAIVDGIPLTSVPRTIFDLASSRRDEEVEAMLREAEYRRLDDALSLPDLLARYPGRRGSRTVRAALRRLAESPGRIETSLEERFVPFLDRHRLIRPHFNAWLQVKGHRYRVDCLWRAQRQIVELDGWAGHRTRTAFRDDRARDRRLRADGYSVTRVTWSQLEDEPEEIAADLRRLLGLTG